MKLPNIIIKIAKDIASIGGMSLVVGGSVRDHFLGIYCNDFDIEIYQISDFTKLYGILKKYGHINMVGKSFCVLKFRALNIQIDFSLPRLENKTGNRHNEFLIDCNANLSFKQAFKRRDFTINAIGFNIITKEFIDPYNGIKDLKNRLLKQVDKTSFIEDPLRVYRAIQFSARFKFKISSNTKKLCKKMVSLGDLDYLPKERIYDEFKKIFLKSTKPSIAFELLKEFNILPYFPELLVLNTTNNSDWKQTMMALDKMVELKTKDNKIDLILFFAILCHKLQKQPIVNLYDTNIDKEDKTVVIFLNRLTYDKKLIKSVKLLTKYHLVLFDIYKTKSKSKIRRLALKVNIEHLVLLTKAINLSKNDSCIQCDWLLRVSKELNVNKKAMKNIINGKDLINLGITPGKNFKKILDYIYNLQLNGKITNKSEAIIATKEYILKFSLLLCLLDTSTFDILVLLIGKPYL